MLIFRSFTGGSDGKESVYNTGDLGWTPVSGRSPGEGNGNPLQCPCLEDPRDGGAWWAAVYGVARRRTRLSASAAAAAAVITVLSILSCVCWPSLCVLWRDVCLVFLPIFYWVFYFLILSCMSCLYILEINSLLVTSFANIYSKSIDRIFIFVYGLLCCAKALKFN